MEGRATFLVEHEPDDVSSGGDRIGVERPPALGAPAPAQRLGASEHLFVALRRFTPTNVVRVLAIDGAFAKRDVEAALAKLAARHPMLRARIADGPSPHLVHGGAPPIRLNLVRRRDDAHWREVLGRVLNVPLAQEPGRHFDFWFLRSDRAVRSELVIAGEHALCDGVSMNHLCGELVRLIAGARPAPPRSILPVLEALLPPFAPLDRAASFGRSLARFTRVAAERAVFESPRGVASSSTHAFAELDRDATDALRRRARAERTTVTGALMAAVLVSVRKVRRGAPRLAMSMPIDLRPRIPRRRLEAADLANFTNAVYLASKADADLWTLARALKGQLDETMAGDRILASLPFVFGGGRRLVREGRPPFAHAMLSSSGLVPIEPDQGAFRIRGFYSATSAPMISADFAFFCNTFDGRLGVNLLFSEEVVTRAAADDVLESVHALLTRQGP